MGLTRFRCERIANPARVGNFVPDEIKNLGTARSGGELSRPREWSRGPGLCRARTLFAHASTRNESNVPVRSYRAVKRRHLVRCRCYWLPPTCGMRQTRRTKRVTVRLAEPLQHELADAAAADGRPLAEYVRWVLVEHAAARMAEREPAVAA
jgi:hypothetical protein